jgi:hypothetical protein
MKITTSDEIIETLACALRYDGKKRVGVSCR